MKTVLITGAASGLGWALSQQAFALGYRVILADMNEVLLEARVEALAARDAERVTSRGLDVTNSDAITLLVPWLEKHGGLDLLINNAGITHRSLAEKTAMSVFQKVMAVDWQAPVELSVACLPLLKKSRGGIINIGSMAGWMPVLGRAGYCSAKSALGQFFEVMRGEVSRYGIHILMAYPSFLDTPIEKNALGHDGKPAAHARSMVGNMRTPEWMAEQVFDAYGKGRKRLFPDRFTWFASVLWRVAPDLYQRLMLRKFASELEQ
ncbi:short-chain dehydrogenase [Alcanivorax sp. P2S70]|uniref:SDR family NAD(P)-dependent oxidoreductase n=1 Tax=Alcanivorax profundi TaxID=2338368 RepID=A0A418XZ24_9GAMM|nr:MULTISPECIES: SDR family NAD(P)-dependent oxidoreductase [Alcanivorax]ERP89219.1 short-chain dehydrogenase [Alcanivorax sp. P2S70]RJG18275.1 SDR family NAD(P)-dependent oxidoreductase [Alcanivorax profundi]